MAAFQLWRALICLLYLDTQNLELSRGLSGWYWRHVCSEVEVIRGYCDVTVHLIVY